jgi:hypothetical protein
MPHVFTDYSYHSREGRGSWEREIYTYYVTYKDVGWSINYSEERLEGYNGNSIPFHMIK